MSIENNLDMDYTYTAAGLTLWTIVEINCGIVVAAIMTLKPLANRFFPLLLGTGLSRRDTGPSTDYRLPPPTIGSRPSKDPFCGTTNHNPWPEEFYEFTDGGHVMTEMERKDPRVTNEVAHVDDMRIYDVEAQRESGTESRGEFLVSPPEAHISGRDTANTFYTSSSDMTASTLLPSRSQG